MRQLLLLLILPAPVLLAGGCAKAPPAGADHAPPTDGPADGRWAPNSDADFLEGYFVPDEADVERGRSASMDMRRAVESYYRRRNWTTYHMPPPMRAVKTVGRYELLWVEAVKGVDRQLVYDPRTKQIVGTFRGYMPGGEYATPSTRPAPGP